MAVKLLFFAQCRKWMKRDEMAVEVKANQTIATLLKTLPELQPVSEKINSLKVSLNHEFTALDSEIRDGDEIAFLPPFSGG